MKAILLSVLLAITVSNALADAVKYRQPNGKILITNQPPPDGSKEVAVSQDEHISATQQQNAINALERQKKYLKAREIANQRAATRTVSAAPIAPGNDTTQLHSCLRSVTATFGLSPAEEARRKVNCYRGTVGLNDECQRTVTATMRISTAEEMLNKRNCPQ